VFALINEALDHGMHFSEALGMKAPIFPGRLAAAVAR